MPAEPDRTLGLLAEGRRNHLNLIRMTAALMVLVSHAFVLHSGNPMDEPGKAWMGVSLGMLAVDTFFLVSGFLVSASLFRAHSVRDYVEARLLRIYPALWCALIATVLVTGWLATALSPAEFLLHPETVRYMVRNGIMILGGVDALPGVFTENPFPGAVNGSLWTLRHEIRLYFVLLVVLLLARELAARSWLLDRVQGLAARAVAAGLLQPGRRLCGPAPVAAVHAVLIVGMALGLFVLNVYGMSTGWHPDAVRLGCLFFGGAAWWHVRGGVQLSGAGVGAGLLVLGALAAAGLQVPFHILWLVVLPPAILWLAYVPKGALLAYNRLGDYSYGTYLYAFPVQQLLMQALPQAPVLAHIVLAGGLVVGLAWLSWHLVEKPVIALRAQTRPRWSAVVLPARRQAPGAVRPLPEPSQTDSPPKQD